MSSKRGLYTSLVFILYCKVLCQVTSTVDTIYHADTTNTFQLNNRFIIKSSLVIQGDGKLILPDKVQSIEGKLSLQDTVKVHRLIVSYDFLSSGLPVSIGPKWKSLPNLNLASFEKKDADLPGTVSSLQKKSNVFSSGSMYRQLTVSPLGGSDFTGGLQIQLNGALSNNMNISGVLTDQDLPIQPEGTTRELDELDQVYLTVTHPNYRVDAGDIIFKPDDKYYNINRKLIGLKNNFNINQWSGTSVYAGSKGNFRSLEIKGRDGDQGPYHLTGKDGNRDIVVLSGTEKVWADGTELVRGKNHDYTIDYSLAEIVFTPRVLIHIDTDLLFEYQYSDFEYQKEFTGGSFKNELSGPGSYSFGFFRESDQYQQQDWSGDIQDSLLILQRGSIRVSTAIQDENGDYIRQGSIYVYSPEIIPTDSMRYSVTFNFDENGAYQRHISDDGRIYYEFISQSERISTRDYFSPYRMVYAPKTHQFGFLNGEYNINEQIRISGQFSGSKLDLNTMNQGDPKNGGSYTIGIQMDSIEFGPMMMSLEIKDWNRSNEYASIGRENDVRQVRFWNLDSTISNGIQESLIQSEIVFNPIGTSHFEVARLIHGNSARTRLRFNQEIFHKRFKNSFFNYTTVKQYKKSFYRSNGRLQINTKGYSPFISVLTEDESYSNRFQKLGGGLNVNLGRWQFDTGVDFRTDELYTGTGSWENESDDFIGYVNYRSLSEKGWKQNIVYKKRIKSSSSNASYDYSLIDLGMGYNQAYKPFQWEIQARKEESFSEERAIVYDSVGAGLGQYRYDPVFNTYISDVNGDFIAYNVLTGNREPNTAIEGSQKFSLDLSRVLGFPDILFRANSRQEFRGQVPTLGYILRPDIQDTSVSRSNIYSRIEMIFSSNHRILTWIENHRSLNGLDPRGNDLNQNNEVGLDLDQTLSKTLLIRNKGKLSSRSLESTVSSLRDRELKGWWNELQLQFRLNNSMDLDFSVVGGSDEGKQQGKLFSSTAFGMILQGQLFFNKTGRFQTGIHLVRAQEKNDMGYIPPEALNGYPVGTSFRTNTRLQYFLNRSVSMVFTLNTINDDRYSNFITFQGEVRAHF